MLILSVIVDITPIVEQHLFNLAANKWIVKYINRDITTIYYITRWKDCCKRDMESVDLKDEDILDRTKLNTDIANHSGDLR